MSTSKRKKHLRESKMKSQAAVEKYQKMLAKSKPRDEEFVEYVPKKSYRPDEKFYPSLKTKEFNTSRPGDKQYTGDLLLGIGTLHKSNLVPVMRGTEQAIEITRMRR